MNFYVATLILWLIVVPITIAGLVGLWMLCAHCWREYRRAETPGSRSGSRASCVGRTGRIESQVTFPREWVLTSSRPYDQENDAA